MSEVNTLFPEQIKMEQPRSAPESFQRQYLRSKYPASVFQAMEVAGSLVRSYSAAERSFVLIRELERAKSAVESGLEFQESYRREFEEEPNGVMILSHQKDLNQVVELELRKVSVIGHEDDHERAMREALEEKIREAMEGMQRPLSASERFSLVSGVGDLAGIADPYLKRLFNTF